MAGEVQGVKSEISTIQEKIERAQRTNPEDPNIAAMEADVAKKQKFLKDIEPAKSAELDGNAKASLKILDTNVAALEDRIKEYNRVAGELGVLANQAKARADQAQNFMQGGGNQQPRTRNAFGTGGVPAAITGAPAAMRGVSPAGTAAVGNRMPLTDKK